MGKKIIILASSASVKNFIYRNQNLIFKFKKNFKEIIIINFKQSKFRNKDSRVKIINLKNYFDLYKFINKNKNYSYLNFIEKNFQNLCIFFLLKLYKIKFFEIYSHGDIKDYKIYFNDSIVGNLGKINYLFSKSLLYFVYSTLGKIGIIQKPSFLIHFFDNYQDQIFSTFNNLVKNNFNILLINLLNFLKIKYYNKIYLINKPLLKLDKKKIKFSYYVFIDSCFNHIDRLTFDRIASHSEKKLYYKKLNIFFLKIQKIYKKKIIFLKHPDSDLKCLKKNLRNIKIISNNTNKYILGSRLVFFHESSVVVTALMLKKKIINLQSQTMGKYYNFRNNIYTKKMNIPSINIDEDISLLQIKRKIMKSNIKYKNYFNNFQNNKLIPRYDIDKLIFKLKLDRQI